MDVSTYIKKLKSNPEFMKNVTSWHVEPPRDAHYGEFPADLDPQIIETLRKRGIQRPYIHQSRAIEAAIARKDFVVVTPTASGKTLCYNVPVLDSILRDPASRALYLFPTKALSSDQVAELYSMIEDMGADIKAYTYDGDTPASARTAIRQAGHVVVTNPDMLHQGILPHHAKWVKLFENLKYVVIDEIHTLTGTDRGNQIICLLSRIAHLIGFHPRRIGLSATVGNPSLAAKKVVITLSSYRAMR